MTQTALELLKEWHDLEGGISTHDATHGIPEDLALRISRLWFRTDGYLNHDVPPRLDWCPIHGQGVFDLVEGAIVCHECREATP
jgi:hypothetical protein